MDRRGGGERPGKRAVLVPLRNPNLLPRCRRAHRHVRRARVLDLPHSRHWRARPALNVAVFAPAPRPTTASPPPTPTPAPPRYTHIPPLEPEEQTVTIKVPQRFPGTSLRRGRN